MSTVAIIPARFGSTRFPGKPLHPIAGIPMIQRVWALAGAAERIDRVVVATDDHRIAELAMGFGATAVMTSEHCRNGTERVLDAAKRLDPLPDAVVNVQGDAVLIQPHIIAAVASALDDPTNAAAVVTPATALSGEALRHFVDGKRSRPASGTTVVCDRDGRALYFSKTVLPFRRKPSGEDVVHHHIGLYGYRMATLQRYTELAPTPLEQAESLEQLRALEHGMTVRVVMVETHGRSHWSVDAPGDVSEVEAILAREGEILAHPGGG